MGFRVWGLGRVTRSARTTTQDVWCGARKGSLISPNPPTQFMTFVGFRVSLPPKPPYQGGLAWRWRRACWLGAVRAVSLRSRNFTPFLALLPFKEAYGKAGPLRETPYAKGRSLREGPVLTGGSLTGMIPFTKKDDEEAYGKAGPLQEAPYGEGRSLREGPVLTGGSLTQLVPFTKKNDEEAYGKAGPLRETLYGERGSLRKALRKSRGALRVDLVTEKDDERLTGRLNLYGKPLTGKGRGALRVPSQRRTKAEPLREAPYGEGRSLREGRVLTGESLTGMAPFTKKDGLWEAMGRDFTRIGREFALVRRKPKTAVFS